MAQKLFVYNRTTFITFYTISISLRCMYIYIYIGDVWQREEEGRRRRGGGDLAWVSLWPMPRPPRTTCGQLCRLPADCHWQKDTWWGIWVPEGIQSRRWCLLLLPVHGHFHAHVIIAHLCKLHHHPIGQGWVTALGRDLVSSFHMQIREHCLGPSTPFLSLQEHWIFCCSGSISNRQLVWITGLSRGC